MNEKLQYAEMLEIPVNTCNITYKPPKKRKVRAKKKLDEVKAELIDKVNSSDEQELQTQPEQPLEQAVVEETLMTPLDAPVEQEPVQTEDLNSLTVNIRKAEKPRRRFKIGVIGVQLAVIGALVATIFITNALFADSGINTFFKGVFGGNATESVDAREYIDFSPVINAGDTLSVTDGVITTDYTGSMYSPCDGEITAVSLGEDDKYTVEITHSENFKTVVGGLQFVYGETGSQVYAKTPLGYINEAGATVSFYSATGAITNFTLNDNTVVWAV